MINRTKKRTFGAGVSMLAGVALFGKLIGAVYRIPLTNILGGEGIGIYQLAFPIYALILVLSGTAIPTCIARLIAEREALGDREGRDKIFLSALAVMAVGGLAGSLIMAALAVPIAALQGAEALKIGYFILCPSVFFVAISGALRGWYQGKSDMRPYSYMQVAEQSAKLVLGVALAWRLSRYGVIYGVMGAFAAVTLSEIIGAAIMAVVYFFGSDKAARGTKIDKDTTKIVIKTAMPIAVNGVIIPVATFIESIILVRLLVLGGRGNAMAIGDYGMLTGVVNTLINMPVVLAIAMSVVVVPTMAKYRTAHNLEAVRNKANLGVRLSVLIGIPCFVVMSLMPGKIIAVLYPSLGAESVKTAVTLLAAGGIQVILLSIQQIYASVLQGLGQQTRIMRVTVIGGALKLVLDMALVPFVGIIGAVISAIVAYGLIAVVNTVQYRRVLGREDGARKSVAKMFVSGLIMAIPVFASSFIANKFVGLAVGIIGGIIVYAVALILSGAFGAEELRGVPIIKRFVKKAENKSG